MWVASVLPPGQRKPVLSRGEGEMPKREKGDQAGFARSEKTQTGLRHGEHPPRQRGGTNCKEKNSRCLEVGKSEVF